MKYNVTVNRYTSDSKDFEVEVDNPEQYDEFDLIEKIEQIALQKAADHDWGTGKSADYEFDGYVEAK